MIAHPAHGVVDVALQRASDMTGIDFGFLLGTAGRESGYDPKAKAPTSSAAGLFQFLDQTWLATLKRHGARYGYARYAALIEQTPDGRFQAIDPAARAAVMSLRLDPRAASLMAGEMAADHANYLRQALGRPPSAGELYAAHFLGVGGTARLILLARTQPQLDAAAQFPEAAKANPTIFRRDGMPLTLAQLYGRLTGAPVADAPAAGGDAAFQRYAAARRAELTGLHHAVIEAALQRRAPSADRTPPGDARAKTVTVFSPRVLTAGPAVWPQAPAKAT